MAAWVAAGLAGVQPVLQCTGQEPIGDIPEVGILVLVCQAVAKVDGLGKSGIKSICKFSHGGSIEHQARLASKRSETGPPEVCGTLEHGTFAKPPPDAGRMGGATSGYSH